MAVYKEIVRSVFKIELKMKDEMYWTESQWSVMDGIIVPKETKIKGHRKVSNDMVENMMQRMPALKLFVERHTGQGVNVPSIGS